MVTNYVMFAGPKDIKDIFSTLKDCAAELSQSNTTLKHQVFLNDLQPLASCLFAGAPQK